VNDPDPDGVAGAIENDGYVILPVRLDGDPGDPVAGFDSAGSVTLVVLVDGVDPDPENEIDVLVEGSAGEDSWSTINEFSTLTAENTPAEFVVDAPPALLRATLTGVANHVEVRAFPHGPRAAVLDNNGHFTNVTKPSVSVADAAHLLAALVELGLVVDDT